MKATDAAQLTLKWNSENGRRAKEEAMPFAEAVNG